MAARETEVTTRIPNFTYLDSGAFGVGNWLVDAEGCLALSDLGRLQEGTWLGHRHKAPPIVILLYSPLNTFKVRCQKDMRMMPRLWAGPSMQLRLGPTSFPMMVCSKTDQSRIAARGSAGHAEMLENVYPGADPQDMKMVRIVLRQLIHEDPDKREGGVHGMTFAQLEQQLRDDCHWDDRRISRRLPHLSAAA
ncbi:hypothetical protein WJX74_010804 [Apatococcus lobatus]|uniref:Uncharacterized protein n=1 Tax=Apatococcus lobatus TaxID=904363 RepID=A0AAW1RZH9_9CHLO